MARNRVRADFDWKARKSPTAFAGRLALFKTLIGNELERAMEASVKLVEREAKVRAPVDTGQLRASIASLVRDDVRGQVVGYVGTNVEHGYFQEFGTVVLNAQPYLRPAIDALVPRIRKNFEKAVDRAAVAAGVT